MWWLWVWVWLWMMLIMLMVWSVLVLLVESRVNVLCKGEVVSDSVEVSALSKVGSCELQPPHSM